jgi:hypothetical protein
MVSEIRSHVSTTDARKAHDDTVGLSVPGRTPGDSKEVCLSIMLALGVRGRSEASRAWKGVSLRRGKFGGETVQGGGSAWRQESQCALPGEAWLVVR